MGGARASDPLGALRRSRFAALSGAREVQATDRAERAVRLIRRNGLGWRALHATQLDWLALTAGGAWPLGAVA